MSYTAVTKPSVGDPIKLSTITGLIDNQDYFSTTLGASTIIGADGSFETAPSGSDVAVGWSKSGTAGVERSSTAGSNSEGQYNLRFIGSGSDSATILSPKFAVDEKQPYVISVGCKNDDAGNQFLVEFITYGRDKSTGPVHTVTQPVLTVGSNSSFNNTSFKKYNWVVDAGTNGKWAEIKITWTCGSTASQGYLDNVTLEPMKSRVVHALYQPFNSGGSIEYYCPKYCMTNWVEWDQQTNQSNADYALYVETDVLVTNRVSNFANSAGYYGNAVSLPTQTGTSNQSYAITYDLLHIPN